MGSPHSLTSPESHAIILFDGVCNLCNGAVQFVIHRDKHQRFRFASLQSRTGNNYLKQFGLKTGEDHLYSIVLIKNGRLYDKSSAALEIAKHLSGAWPALVIFKVVPKILRDAVYDFIAARRYRWFGKKDQCMIPTPALKARFLEP
jgi:predicted DCC family thiol-disulfide oxidoreductase YuxK